MGSDGNIFIEYTNDIKYENMGNVSSYKSD